MTSGMDPSRVMTLFKMMAELGVERKTSKWQQKSLVNTIKHMEYE